MGRGWIQVRHHSAHYVDLVTDLDRERSPELGHKLRVGLTEQVVSAVSPVLLDIS